MTTIPSKRTLDDFLGDLYNITNKSHHIVIFMRRSLDAREVVALNGQGVADMYVLSQVNPDTVSIVVTVDILNKTSVHYNPSTQKRIEYNMASTQGVVRILAEHYKIVPPARNLLFPPKELGVDPPHPTK